MRKTDKVYLETTVPNYAAGQGRPEQQKATKVLLEEVRKGRYEVYISSAVIDEIKATSDPERCQKLEQVLGSIDYQIVEITPKMRELAQTYVDLGIIPEEVVTDALHIAAATLSTVPNLITWNLKHLANLDTIKAVNNYNFSQNLPQLRILTPYELVGHLLDESDF